jgi:O-antigen/teichoic acid export membrane protein
MAWEGWGVWSLAFQAIAATAITTALLWMLNSWRPQFTLSLMSAKRLFKFGGYLLAAELIDTIYERVYTLLIGKIYGVRELGFYSRADSIKQIPARAVGDTVSRVIFPLFSAVNQNKAQLFRGVQLAVRGTMLIHAPMMLGLAAIAEPFVATVFGAQWLPAVPMLRVLCLAAVFWPLAVINLNVLFAQGHSELFFRLEVFKKVIGSVLIITGSFYGVMGIAWAQVIFSVLAFVMNSYFTGKYLGYGPMAQWRDFGPLIGVAFFMASCVFGIGVAWQGAQALELIVMIVAGVFVFLVLTYTMKLGALRDVLKFVGWDN